MALSAASVVRVAFGILALAALVAGYVGLHAYAAYPGNAGELLPTPLNLLYWDLQLFVFDSEPLNATDALPTALEFARFAAPGVTIYTLFEGGRLLLATCREAPPEVA